MNRIMKRMALPVGAAIVLGSSGFAFMASNTVGTTYAGDGQGKIAGYTLQDYNYQTSSNDSAPVKVSGVQFQLNGTAEHATAFIWDGANYVSYGSCLKRGANYQGGFDQTQPTAYWECHAGASQWVKVEDAQYLRIEANN